jgi:hypothetical protein
MRVNTSSFSKYANAPPQPAHRPAKASRQHTPEDVAEGVRTRNPERNSIALNPKTDFHFSD